MDLTLLSFLWGAIILFALYLANIYRYWSKHGIPCAKGTIPLFGHMLPVLTMRNRIVDICGKIYEEFPNASMVGFYKLTKPVLLIREPQLVRIVLESNFASFQANAFQINKIVDPLIAKSIVFTHGEDWLGSRRLFHTAFTGPRLQLLFQSVKGVCNKFVDFLERNLKTRDKYEVELKDLFSKFVGEIIANGGFGIEGHCFEDKDESSSFYRLGKSFLDLGFWTGFGQSLALYMPELNSILKVGFVPKRVNTFFRTLIRELLKNRKHETVPRNDFFHSLLELETNEGVALDEELLTAHALNFFIKASDPTSTVLSFIGYHFAKHPDVQKKVREEVLSVIYKHNGRLTYESLKEMTYIEQVISESQRFYHIAGFAFRMCTEECELSGADGLRVCVKPGTLVYVPIKSLHMDPKYWVDPETFDPERFNVDRKQDIEKFACFPFGRGPRTCVGKRMGTLMVKACMATILKSYSFELSPKTKLPVTLSPRAVLTTPVGGLWVYIKRI